MFAIPFLLALVNVPLVWLNASLILNDGAGVGNMFAATFGAASFGFCFAIGLNMLQNR